MVRILRWWRELFGQTETPEVEPLPPKPEACGSCESCLDGRPCELA